MTQEDKELLIKDLCARLPYKVICRKDAKTVDGESFYLDEYPSALELTKYLNCDIEVNIKLYLRPMSSMTEEEYKEYTEKLKGIFYGSLLDNALVIDWLNAHHFDYRGLIKRGLALEAPNEIYNN